MSPDGDHGAPAEGRPRPATGRLYGVGVGPGDPDLVTLKAARLIGAADVVAYPRARGDGVARTIAGPHLRVGVIELPLTYPVTVEPTDDYEAELAAFYDRSAAGIATHLDAGRDVVVLCEGDPFFYGSFMYLHERLAHRYPTEVVPGVTRSARPPPPRARRWSSATRCSRCCRGRCRSTSWRRGCARPTPP
jgi:precorrin-2 C(20)-methyltransferase